MRGSAANAHLAAGRRSFITDLPFGGAQYTAAAVFKLQKVLTDRWLCTNYSYRLPGLIFRPRSFNSFPLGAQRSATLICDELT
jgi:hypothetical protein